MARWARGVDLDQKRVGIAIQPEVDQVQDVAAGISLPPETIAGAAVEVDLAGAQGRLDRLAIHVGEHEHGSRGRVLHDGRDQAAVVEPDALDHAASAPGRNIDAARPASLPVLVKRSTKWLTAPAPPDAITGTRTASATRATRSRSKPSRVPSRSIEVRRISPAPAATPRRAHSIASSPVEM